MNKSLVVFFLVCSLLVITIYGDSSESSSSEEDKKEKKASSMYQELYCQTELVMREKLIELPETAENGFKILAGDDVDQLDCGPVLERSKAKIYTEMRKKHKKNKELKKSADCSMKKFEEQGYDKLRFKMNSLLGLDLPNAKKSELRAEINREITEVIEQSVDECATGSTTPLPIDIRGGFQETNAAQGKKEKKKSSSEEE